MIGPPTEERFFAALAALGPGRRLALAVSGGPDSLALLLLARRFADEVGCEVHGLTVDHGLRAEAAAEAQVVAQICAELGVPHDILVWGGDKPAANLQAEAREARYRLLGDWCLANEYSDLLVAHHFDDQVETFLLRLARGSGVDGLSAMAGERSLREAPGVRVLRPLLGFSKEELRALVAEAGLQAVEDPSNLNPAFDRVKVRQLRASLEDLGLSGERLVGTAARMAEARAALEEMVDAAQEELVTTSPFGFVQLDCRGLARLPDEIGRRLLSRLLRQVSGRAYRPRFEKADRLYQELKIAGQGDWTLHHCAVHLENWQALIWREMRPLPESIDLSCAERRRGVWDGRYFYDVEGRPGLFLGVLGEAGFRLLKSEAPEAIPLGVPRGALLAAPAFWERERLLAVPGTGFGDVPGKGYFLGPGL
ncbi:MAG: tRNA lysidine(34) synthetase TilS [Alphaproteobacteria bacterium]|nr:MAG: tRNA lysidine(34) synthetase TilS [Alphaproteobacteria bacterium]